MHHLHMYLCYNWSLEKAKCISVDVWKCGSVQMEDHVEKVQV